MKIFEIERKITSQNPLNNGILLPISHEAKDHIRQVQSELLREIKYIKSNLPLKQQIKLVKYSINSLGNQKTLKIENLISFKKVYDQNILKSDLSSIQPIVYIYKNKYFIIDGDEKVIKSKIKGKKDIVAKVIDTKAISKYTQFLYNKRSNVT